MINFIRLNTKRISSIIFGKIHIDIIALQVIGLEEGTGN